MDKIPFSVVTTCRSEMKSLPRWKQNILEQTRQPDEVVIVDAFSVDGTFEYLCEWAKEDKRIKVIREKGAVAHGRNVAIENASFEHILSTDMGVRLANVWCEELILPFEKDTTIDVVAGNTCIDIELITSKVARAEYYFEKGGFANLKAGHIPGNRSIAYKRKIWNEVGKLPEDLTFAADDSVFGRQLVQEKFKFDYAPNAMTYWGRPQKFQHFFREAFVYGKGDGEALIKTPLVFKWYLNRKIPGFLVPIFNVFINFLKAPVYKGMKRSLHEIDFISFCLIPLLVAGKSYNYAKGYIIGYDSGNQNCTVCRNRLKRDLNGYSII